MSCSQCGYNMEPLDTVCRKCKGQGVANAASAAPTPPAPPQTPTANPWQQAPPLNPTNQMGAYQRPDYVPHAPPKRGINGNMILGGCICLFGIIATTMGYFGATPGRSYTIFWGAIVFGAFRFFRGMTNN